MGLQHRPAAGRRDDGLSAPLDVRREDRAQSDGKVGGTRSGSIARLAIDPTQLYAVPVSAVLTVAALLSTSSAASDSSTSWLDYVSPAIAALALLVSCVLGFLNRRSSQRAIQLAERQEARRESHLELYLHTSGGRRRPSTGDRVLEFHILIKNLSDRPTSLVAAELHVTYSIDGVMTTLKVRHASAELGALATPDVTPLAFPRRLDANDALDGWLRFGLPSNLFSGREIDRYDLVIRDVHGYEETLQVRVITEVLIDAP